MGFKCKKFLKKFLGFRKKIFRKHGEFWVNLRSILRKWTQNSPCFRNIFRRWEKLFAVANNSFLRRIFAGESPAHLRRRSEVEVALANFFEFFGLRPYFRPKNDGDSPSHLRIFANFSLCDRIFAQKTKNLQINVFQKMAKIRCTCEFLRIFRKCDVFSP